MKKTVLWWGRYDADYSRNRVVHQAFTALGWECRVFRPLASPFAALEARLRGVAKPDLVWVPCFRQRDVMTARRWCAHHRVPLVFDPLISSYDKQVFERRKFTADSPQARRLLKKERTLFGAADRVVADTDGHADFFTAQLGVAPGNAFVVPVGAEESLFFPEDGARPAPAVPEVLFYGSFLSLQGPQVIIEAARCYQGPPVRWCLLGSGPLRTACETAAHGLNNVSFEEWVPYDQLPARIRRADILLGIFGDSDKATRVIPNKAYQTLACGKPLITRTSPAYPPALQATSEGGIAWVPPNNPAALAEAVATLVRAPARLPAMGHAARRSYDQYFSSRTIQARLDQLLQSLTRA